VAREAASPGVRLVPAPAASQVGCKLCRGSSWLWGKETRFGRGAGVTVIAGRAGLGVVVTRLLYRVLCGLVRVLVRGGGERDLELGGIGEMDGQTAARSVRRSLQTVTNLG